MATSKRDSGFWLSTFWDEQAQTTPEYKGFQRDIQDYGFQIIKSGTDTVKVYRPELALMFSSKGFPARIRHTKTETTINGGDYLKTYIEAYKEGEQYFENEIKVSPSTMYGAYAEQYVKGIHFNFFHAQHTGTIEGWGYVKNSFPIILTHQAIKEHGYYSGIVSKVEEEIKKHPLLFAKFDKSDHETTLQQAERMAVSEGAEHVGNDTPLNQLSLNEQILRFHEFDLKADRLKLERKKLNAELMADTSAPQQDTEAATDTQGGKFLSFNLTDEKKLEITKELGQYVDNPNLLEQLLSEKVVNDKIKITCHQNEFAEVFKRLEYNGATVQKSRFIIDWLCTNFIQSEGKQFNDRTIRDLFKASGKPPKTPICNFDWLTFKEPTQLAKEAQAKLIESYPT